MIAGFTGPSWYSVAMAGYKANVCCACGRTLVHDEVALSRKLIDRDDRKNLCLHCFSQAYHVTEAQLKEKIAFFKEIGCSLF